MKELFDAFRKEVLAIDPCVTEEFLKLYIAYKAETNFVDVIPQAKRLRLIAKSQVFGANDPKGHFQRYDGYRSLGQWRCRGALTSE